MVYDEGTGNRHSKQKQHQQKDPRMGSPPLRNKQIVVLASCHAPTPYILYLHITGFTCIQSMKDF